MSEAENPSMFSKAALQPGGFEITGGYLTVTGESRRQQLEIAARQVLDHFNLQAVTLRSPIQYVPDYTLDNGYLDSIVLVDLDVPVSINPRGRVKFEINVPPFLDWGKQVLEIVLNYVAVWAQQNSL